MACDDGSGCFLGFTVTQTGLCSVNSGDIADVQALTRQAGEAITVSSTLRVNSFGEFSAETPFFESPRVDDPCGSWANTRFSCVKMHAPFTCAIEFNGEYDISLLLGSEGTIRRSVTTLAAVQYVEGTGRITQATILPAQAAGEESVGQITVKFTGGSTTAITYGP